MLNPRRHVTHGHVIHTKPSWRERLIGPSDPLDEAAPWRGIDFVVAVLALALLGATLALLDGHAVPADGINKADTEAAARLEAARLAVPEHVGAAYEQGLHDAMQAVKHTPDGVALAQACLALRGVR